MAAPGPVNAHGNALVPVSGPASFPVQVPLFGFGSVAKAHSPAYGMAPLFGSAQAPGYPGMGMPLQRRSMGQGGGQGGGRATPQKRMKMSSTTGLFNQKWRCYAQMDQELILEALNRADPGAWTGVGLGSKNSNDKAAAMALAFERFDDSPLETHEPDAWYVMMAQQYIALGRRLEGKTQSVVLQEGQELLRQHHDAAMAHQQLQHDQAQARMVQMQQAQAQSHAFMGNSWASAGHLGPLPQTQYHLPGPAPTSALTLFQAPGPAPAAALIQPAQAPSMGDIHQDPTGRPFVKGLGRSRYLNREASGGAEDWRMEPDGTVTSPSKQLSIHIIDLLSGQSLAEAWPAGASGASSSAAEEAVEAAPIDANAN